jgi:hypothetical protein
MSWVAPARQTSPPLKERDSSPEVRLGRNKSAPLPGGGVVPLGVLVTCLVFSHSRWHTIEPSRQRWPSCGRAWKEA